MGKQKIYSLLLHEEKRTLKIYFLTFYITFVLFDIFYFFLYPKFILHTSIGFHHTLGYWNYLILFGLIPVSYLLVKMGKQNAIKYIYVFTYLVLCTIYDVIVFSDDPDHYQSGNAAELILVLFSPLFINKRFFWVVSLGTILRYLFVGITIHSTVVMLPIVLIIILAVIAYIMLNRFSSYIDSLREMHEELRQKEKLTFIGQMATSIGHEIRNPLASLKGLTQLQREKYPSDQKYYSIMEQEIDRINSIVNDLLMLGKPRLVSFQKNNLKDIITYCLTITQQLASKKKIELVEEIDDHLPLIECDKNQLKQVFINLIKNGIDSMSSGGIIKIHSLKTSHTNVSVSFIDQGCGIEQAEMHKLYEPFYTTKEDGTGLGLLVTKKIIDDHQGELQFESEVNKGTKVTVILPITQ